MWAVSDLSRLPVFSVCVGVLPLAPSNALREVAVRKKELF